MNPPKPTVAALYLALVFVAGAVAGAAGGYQWGRSAVIRPNRPGDMGKFMIERLTTELELRPGQLAEITPIITNTTARIRALHKDSWKQVGQMIEESNSQIRALLDDHQKQLFDAMEARRRERDRERNRDRAKPGPGRTEEADTPGEPSKAGPRPLSCRTTSGKHSG